MFGLPLFRLEPLPSPSLCTGLSGAVYSPHMSHSGLFSFFFLLTSVLPQGSSVSGGNDFASEMKLGDKTEAFSHQWLCSETVWLLHLSLNSTFFLSLWYARTLPPGHKRRCLGKKKRLWRTEPNYSVTKISNQLTFILFITPRDCHFVFFYKKASSFQVIIISADSLEIFSRFSKCFFMLLS